MKPTYDERDIRILKILQEDGRASYSYIARKLGISEAAVYARIQKLIKQGIIKKFQAILDAEKLGLNLTAIIAVKAHPKKYDSVLKSLSKIPDIQEIYDVTGDYYCIIKLRTYDRESLASLIDKIGALEGVEETETRVVLRIVKESYSIPLKSL